METLTEPELSPTSKLHNEYIKSMYSETIIMIIVGIIKIVVIIILIIVLVITIIRIVVKQIYKQICIHLHIHISISMSVYIYTRTHTHTYIYIYARKTFRVYLARASALCINIYSIYTGLFFQNFRKIK